MTEDDLIEVIIKAEFDYNDKIMKTYPKPAVDVLRRMLQVINELHILPRNMSWFLWFYINKTDILVVGFISWPLDKG